MLTLPIEAVTGARLEARVLIMPQLALLPVPAEGPR
jgi:hypothetical protein